MPQLFPVIDVTEWELVENEVLGANPKSWVRRPGGGRDRQDDWLFKPIVVPPSTGRTQGENWAEKIVSELGVLLGAPCASVELASRSGVPGSISRNVVPPGWDRVLGSELLAATEPSYRGPFLGSDGRERRPSGRPGHSPPAIAAALARCEAPLRSGLANGMAAFAGYVVLDAWVANQDRHDQNWAVLRSAVGSQPHVLAPSYDHASSVGFNLTDEKRADVLDREGGLTHFVSRARADRFEHDPLSRSRSVRHSSTSPTGCCRSPGRRSRSCGSAVWNISVRRMWNVSSQLSRNCRTSRVPSS